MNQEKCISDWGLLQDMIPAWPGGGQWKPVRILDLQDLTPSWNLPIINNDCIML